MGAQSVTKDMIVAALRGGFTDSQIAQQLGVSQSAILQAIDAHGLREIASINSKFAAHDEKLNDLESVVLDKLTAMMKCGIVLDPLKLTAIYKTLNGAKRRSMAEGRELPGNNVQLISINLPQHIQVKVGLNSRNEVISVGENPLNTLPAGKLVDLAGNRESIRGALSHESSTPNAPNTTHKSISPENIADIL